MITARLTHGLLSALFTIIVVTAIAVRGLVPTGYMPAQHGKNIFAMTICTLTGPQTVLVDENMKPTGGKTQTDHDATQKPCEFAANAASTITDMVTASVIAVSWTDYYNSVHTDDVTHTAAFFGNASSQSPPLAHA